MSQRTSQPSKSANIIRSYEQEEPCIELHPNTKVLTPVGFKTVSKLNAGDYIINSKNETKQLVSVEEKPIKDMYIVEFTNNTRLACTSNTTLGLKTIRQHRDFDQLGLLPLKVVKEVDSIKNTSNDYKWQINHYYGLTYKKDSNMEILEDDFYVDGFLFGCLVRTINDVRLTSKHLDRIRKELNKNLHERFDEEVRIRTFNGLKNSFKCTDKLQLHLFKLENYKHSEVELFTLLSQPVENRIAFLEGVLDSRDSRGKLISKDCDFLRVVGLLAQSVGLQVLHHNYKNTKAKTSITLKLFKTPDGDLVSNDVGSIENESSAHIRISDINVTTSIEKVIKLIVADRSGVVMDTFLSIGG